MEPIGRPDRWIRSDWVWREQAFLAASGTVTKHIGRPRVIIVDSENVLAEEFARDSDRADLVVRSQLEPVLQEAAYTSAHAIIVNEPSLANLITAVRKAARIIPGTPIVGCTIPRSISRALEAGAQGYLIKPIRRSDIQWALSSLGKPIRRVLLAEDDPECRDLLHRMLLGCEVGLQIAVAASGSEALAQLVELPPDLVLLDVVMPDLDGWQVLRRIREVYSPEEMPVIFISAQDPIDEPLASQLLIVAMEHGIPIHKLLPCALALADEMVKFEAKVDSGLE